MHELSPRPNGANWRNHATYSSIHHLFDECCTYFVRTVGHGGPGEVDHVAGDASGLQEAGLGHVLLDLGQDRDHADDDGKDLEGKKVSYQGAKYKKIEAGY